MIDAAPPIGKATLGAAGRDEKIEHLCTQVRNMAADRTAAARPAEARPRESQPPAQDAATPGHTS